MRDPLLTLPVGSAGNSALCSRFAAGARTGSRELISTRRSIPARAMSCSSSRLSTRRLTHEASPLPVPASGRRGLSTWGATQSKSTGSQCSTRFACAYSWRAVSALSPAHFLAPPFGSATFSVRSRSFRQGAVGAESLTPLPQQGLSGAAALLGVGVAHGRKVAARMRLDPVAPRERDVGASWRRRGLAVLILGRRRHPNSSA